MVTTIPTTKLRRRPLGPYRYTRRRWHALFLVLDTVGAVVFGLGRSVRRGFERLRFRRPRPESDPQRILLVQLDHLGDAILTTAMLAPLRRRYPAAFIDVLASPWNEAVFRACPEIDTVHVSRCNRFARDGRRGWLRATLAWGLRLRRYRYDLAIDLRGEFPLAVLLWLSGARRRLGWACGGGGFLLTASPAYVPERPEVESRAALLAELDIWPAAGEPAWRPHFQVSKEAQAAATQRWNTLRETESRPGPRIVFHVGAGTAAKLWPAEHWRELLGRTLTEFDAKVVLVGSPGDRIIAQRILGAEAWPRVVDTTGRLSIAELAGVLHQAELMVGADSGPAHLAAAVGTPVVCLFSGTNSARQWQPWGPQVTVLRQPVACSPCHRDVCPRPDHPCMGGLAPACVTETMRNVLITRLGKATLEDSSTLPGPEPQTQAMPAS